MKGVSQMYFCLESELKTGFTMTEVWLAFSAGLVGSIHCLGMCGGIVAALAMTGPQGRLRTRFFGQALYNLGRISTYAILGAAAGLIGSSLDLLAVKSVAFWFFCAANLFVIAVGLASLFRLSWFNLCLAGNGTGEASWHAPQGCGLRDFLPFGLPPGTLPRFSPLRARLRSARGCRGERQPVAGGCDHGRPRFRDPACAPPVRVGRPPRFPAYCATGCSGSWESLWHSWGRRGCGGCLGGWGIFPGFPFNERGCIKRNRFQPWMSHDNSGLRAVSSRSPVFQETLRVFCEIIVATMDHCIGVGNAPAPPAPAPPPHAAHFPP